MELVLLFLEVKGDLAAQADETELNPLGEKLNDAHGARHAVDEDVEVALEAVLKRGHLKELGHQLFGINAAAQIQRQLKTAQVGLVAVVADLLELALLEHRIQLCHDDFHGGGVGDLEDLNAVVRLVVDVASAQAHRALARGVDLADLLLIVEQDAAAREVGSLDQLHHLVHREVGLAQERNGAVADLGKVEGADVGGHANCDTHVGHDENVGEGGGKENGLLHGSVVVVDHVHGILVDAGKQLRTDRIQFTLGVTGGGVLHLGGILLAKGALGVHQGVEQGGVAAGEADHGLVDGGITVGIELHGLSHDVGTFRPRTRQKTHLIHCVEQLSVRGLEAVDLGDRTRNDNAHDVGHVVLLDGLRNGLVDDGSVDKLLFAFVLLFSHSLDRDPFCVVVSRCA